MTKANIDKVRRALDRVDEVHQVKEVAGHPDEVAVRAEDHALREVKPALRRIGYEYKRGGLHPYREHGGGDWHIFKREPDRRRGRPPRNSSELMDVVRNGGRWL